MTPSFPARLAPLAASGRVVSRRELLASVGGAAAVSSVRADRPSAPADGPVDGDGTLRVRVYPAPVPFRVRLRGGVDGVGDHWTSAHRDALAAVENALAQLVDYSREGSRLEGLDIRVERGELVRLPLSSISDPTDALFPSLEAVLEGFHDRLRSREALTAGACHLLLDWSPLNYRVGYGGTRSPNALVGDREASSGDALTVANLGATERWDSRAVSRNMAIHEVLHTLVSSDVAESVGGSGCDHDLGVAEQVTDGTMRVSPIATAYAGPDAVGGGTRFHGTGCYDHDEFHRHDGTDGVDEWTYTTDLSPATLEAMAHYLEGVRL